jgi:hypothetical protein
MRIFFGMCFALIVVAITKLRVATMHHNKDTQKEIVIIEAIVWVGWAFVFSAGYLLATVTF